jgi:hypothetical protein
VEQAERVHVVELGASDELFAHLLLTAVESGPGDVLVDLGGAELVPALTLALLRRAAAVLGRQRRRLVVVVRSERLLRVLQLTLLHVGLTIARSRDEAEHVLSRTMDDPERTPGDSPTTRRGPARLAGDERR